MGRRAKEHTKKVILGQEQPFRQAFVEYAVLRCGRCGGRFHELSVTEHLMKCQPNGARCGKCKGIFKPEEFLAHFKGCRGLKPVELDLPVYLKVSTDA